MKTQLTGLFLSRLRNKIRVERSSPRLRLIKRQFLSNTLFFSFYLLRWSHDGKFFARMTSDTLSIYETPVSSCLFLHNIYYNVSLSHGISFKGYILIIHSRAGLKRGEICLLLSCSFLVEKL